MTRTLVWVTRAEPAIYTTAARLTAMGYEVLAAPVIATRALDFTEPPPAAALAFTSAAAVLAFDGASYHDLPVFTVGDATAKAALGQGYRQVESADGDVRDLAALLRKRAPPGPILNPCARETAGDLAGELGDRLIQWQVYETVPQGRLAEDAQNRLLREAATGRLVGLTCQSPSAGRAVSALLAGADFLQLRAALVVFAASKACAATFDPEEFFEIHISRFPREDALLKLMQNRLERQPSSPPAET